MCEKGVRYAGGVSARNERATPLSASSCTETTLHIIRRAITALTATCVPNYIEDIRYDALAENRELSSSHPSIHGAPINRQRCKPSGIESRGNSSLAPRQLARPGRHHRRNNGLHRDGNRRDHHDYGTVHAGVDDSEGGRSGGKGRRVKGGQSTEAHLIVFRSRNGVEGADGVWFFLRLQGDEEGVR